MVLQYKKVGRWRDYLFGERVYIILSLTAKTGLGLDDLCRDAGPGLDPGHVRNQAPRARHCLARGRKKSLRPGGENKVPIKIVTDSSCDLPADLVARHGITVVPLYINIGKKSYLDGIDMTHEQFYDGLPHFESHPTTSAQAPGSWLRCMSSLRMPSYRDYLNSHRQRPECGDVRGAPGSRRDKECAGHRVRLGPANSGYRLAGSHCSQGSR